MMPAIASFDVVIPARNEEATVAGVVMAAKAARGARRIIVIDDHSSDATAQVASEAGAEVLTSHGNGSKALALATGVAVSDAEVLLFFDADILDATPLHFEMLAAPVLDGVFAMCCGIIDYGALRNPLFVRLPPITGLRALRRDVFTAIPAEKLNGFQIEIMINEVVARGGLKAAIRILDGCGHRSKLEKLGHRRGLRAHTAMTLELLRCLTFVPLWTYGAYLRNLTILPPAGADRLEAVEEPT